MRAAAGERGVYLHGFTTTPAGQGHWNSHGHRLAAELLTEALWPRLQDRLKGP